jgi:hypothetical protein
MAAESAGRPPTPRFSADGQRLIRRRNPPSAGAAIAHRARLDLVRTPDCIRLLLIPVEADAGVPRFQKRDRRRRTAGESVRHLDQIADERWRPI